MHRLDGNTRLEFVSRNAKHYMKLRRAWLPDCIQINSPIDLLASKITKIRTRQSYAIAFAQERRTAWHVT
ncbi:uncharacterized protein EAE97_010477 [Botrytis byssoidea]|uniref:Uncharacterized protein n=1 Tax=Botrytis byssoidea TaxID=139641 RepID=A0A9P5HZM5_9HELO|nr:uncharacterized protein EAE97_010477 [Botrytis byssoidea]KAF7925396.1 hypothetical protein EAE97_010477 [Botrytis byssoidea]